MKTSHLVCGLALILALTCLSDDVLGGPPWSLIPFRRAEADVDVSYELREEHGPWLVLAASFAGDGSEEQARELCRELRSRYRLQAYIHQQTYDYTEPVMGRTIDKYGNPKRMRYANSGKYDAIAVLVGHYDSVNDPEMARTLERLKYATPDSLDLRKERGSTQRFAGLRDLYRRINGNEEKRKRGPMGSAFATRNPLLPAEYFETPGVDEFVASLNRNVEFSLLENPGKFTVRVATFRGKETIDSEEIAELESQRSAVSNKLEIAADQAHRLTVALRKNDVEAYEFHDRTESIVTIGSFDSEGSLLPTGAIDINPAMLQIINAYRPIPQRLPNGSAEVGLRPRTLSGIPFDVQPVPIRVPKRSFAAAYARRSGLK